LTCQESYSHYTHAASCNTLRCCICLPVVLPEFRTMPGVATPGNRPWN
jgi:hypothetical protein